jgi:DNA repair protein RAD5
MFLCQESELLEVARTNQSQARATSTDPSSSADVILRTSVLSESTKLTALLQALRRLRDQDPCYRTVVFSQWTSFLDLIADGLDREGLAWYRLDGSMTQIARTRAIKEFQKPSRSPKVFIVVCTHLH